MNSWLVQLYCKDTDDVENLIYDLYIYMYVHVCVLCYDGPDSQIHLNYICVW